MLLGTIPAYFTVNNHSEAIFGQTTFDFGHYSPSLTGLSLTTGLRYTWEHSFTSTTIIAPPAVEGSVDDDYLSYNVTLDYDLAANVHTYITARDAYKSGGVNGPVPDDSAFHTFPPERLSDVEIGLKSQFTTNVEVREHRRYRGDYQDIQRTTQENVNGIVLDVTRSAAEGRISGLESHGDARNTVRTDAERLVLVHRFKVHEGRGRERRSNPWPAHRSRTRRRTSTRWVQPTTRSSDPSASSC